MHTVIADVTRANINSEVDLIRRLLTHLPVGPERTLTVVCNDLQRPNLSDSGITAHFEVDHSSDFRTVAAVVANLTRQALQQGATKVTVLSFHAVVFELASRFPAPTTEFVSWKTVPYLPGGQMTAYAARRWEWPSELPETDAVDVLRRSLEREGAHNVSSGVRQTDLRYILERNDDRLKKTHQAGRTPLLISQIIKAAQRRAVVEIGGDHTNPIIWVRQPASVVTGPEPTLAAATAQNVTKRPSRSQSFMNTLRAAGYGPYSDYRLALYSHLRDVILEANPNGARHVQIILRLVIDRLKAQISGRFGKQKAEEFSWRKLHEFLGKLLSRNAVLVDDQNNRISPSFATLSTPVATLVPEFELELDGVLVYELVERVSDISVHDMPQLAGALYMDRTDSDIDRVAQVVALLRERLNVQETGNDNHFLVLGPNKKLGQTPSIVAAT
jgi:hypothetical protein